MRRFTAANSQLEVGALLNPVPIFGVIWDVDCNPQVLEIHPGGNSELSKVHVRVFAGRSALIEGGAARLHRTTGIWRYRLRSGPVEGPYEIEVKAISAADRHPGTVRLGGERNHVWLESECGGHIRRADVWYRRRVKRQKIRTAGFNPPPPWPIPGR